MPINFPSNPSLNQTYNLGSRTWKFNGNSWDLQPLTAGYTGSQGYTGSKGDIGYAGSQGYTGSAGSTGFTGSAGATGSTGFTGSTGSTGFTGSVGGAVWQSGQTSNFNAVSNQAYFVDTTSTAITATLPASATLGDEINFIDVAGTFDTNNLTIARNGHNIQGVAENLVVSVERSGLSLVYYNATQGWLLKYK